MIDTHETEERLQRTGIGNPRLHIVVRDDWPRPRAWHWSELLLWAALGLALAVAWWVP